MAKQKSNRKSENGREGTSLRTGMGRDALAVALLALGTATAIALVTFSAMDAQLIEHGVPPVSNLVGPVGHHVASALFHVLGFSALVLPVALITTSIALFRGQPPRVTLVGSAAYAVLTASLATLAHLFLSGRGLSSFAPGGIVGRLLCTRAELLLGSVGTALVVGAGAAVALIVATDVKLPQAWAVVWGALRAAWGWTIHRISDAIDRHRAAVGEMRAEQAAERSRREELAASTVVEDAKGEEREGLAVAGALVLERKRGRLDDEPAWATSSEEQEVLPRRRRRAREEKLDDEPDLQATLPLVISAVTPEPTPAPVVVEAGPDRPEIVVSAAMQERGKRKKKDKDAPEFAFMQSGEVFQLPGISLLTRHEQPKGELDEAGMQKVAEVIVGTLRQHGVDGAIRHIRPGPVVTLYEFMPVAGVKLSRIENLDKELTMALSATRIRIIAPIPGKGVVGIEVPNRDRANVYLRDVIECDAFERAAGLLPLALGKNIEGIPYCVDLQRMPHLLIAGTTGAGKSVGLNTMILSLLYRHAPDQVRMIMVDPKMTELSIYEDIPHLLLPVVTDPQKAARALQWAVDEMERRTQILADTGSKDLKSYNAKVDKLRAEGRTFQDDDEPPPKKLLVVDATEGETEEEAAARLALEQVPLFEDPTRPPVPGEKKAPQKLPYMVVVIDELADLMMTAPREVEISLARLAQKARATGIHLIVATQRPSTDVITGMIKNNFPARISFRLASRHDSTTIINGPGAEALLGDGDMLVLTATQPVTRVQGAFVSEEEIAGVVGFLKQQGRPVFDESILKARDGSGDSRRDDDEDDPVYDEALALVSRMEEVSVSKLQREMRLGYNKAAKIVERMEREGVVGPPNGVKPRQVLIRPAGEVSAVPNV